MTKINFRIGELQISPTQTVPWHYHGNVQDDLGGLIKDKGA
jgi:hypothetical protein